MRTALICIAVALATASTTSAAFLITSKQIKNGTIQPIDLSARAKRVMQGRQGPAGPPGVQSLTEVTSERFVGPGETDSASAICPEGSNPISGGAAITAGYLWATYRSGRAWVAAGTNYTNATGVIRAYAYCSPDVTIR